MHYFLPLMSKLEESRSEEYEKEDGGSGEALSDIASPIGGPSRVVHPIEKIFNSAGK